MFVLLLNCRFNIRAIPYICPTWLFPTDNAHLSMKCNPTWPFRRDFSIVTVLWTFFRSLPRSVFFQTSPKVRSLDRLRFQNGILVRQPYCRLPLIWVQRSETEGTKEVNLYKDRVTGISNIWRIHGKLKNFYFTILSLGSETSVYRCPSLEMRRWLNGRHTGPCSMSWTAKE